MPSISHPEVRGQVWCLQKTLHRELAGPMEGGKMGFRTKQKLKEEATSLCSGL